MIQGRNEDENNPSMSDSAKRRRPIIRTAFCWCWEQTEGAGDWEPYTPEITSLLEEAFLSQKPEVDVQIGQGMYTVNFTQMYQFNVSDTSKRHNVKRFGTQLTQTFMSSLGCGGLSKQDMINQMWEPQQQPFFASQNLKQCEQNSIMRMMSNGVPCNTTLHQQQQHLYI